MSEQRQFKVGDKVTFDNATWQRYEEWTTDKRNIIDNLPLCDFIISRKNKPFTISKILTHTTQTMIYQTMIYLDEIDKQFEVTEHHNDTYFWSSDKFLFIKHQHKNNHKRSNKDFRRIISR